VLANSIARPVAIISKTPTAESFFRKVLNADVMVFAPKVLMAWLIPESEPVLKLSNQNSERNRKAGFTG
jgi:hypothetical protein